jgi:hypothetical protein
MAGAARAQRMPGSTPSAFPKDLPGKWSGVLTAREQSMPFEFELYEQNRKPAERWFAVTSACHFQAWNWPGIN